MEGAQGTLTNLRGTRMNDNIVGPLSYDFAGATLRYKLSTGATQVVTMGVDEVTMTTTDQAAVSGFYRARLMKEGMYLIHWVNADRTVHVGIVVNLNSKEVFVGAKMPETSELFDKGTLEEVSCSKDAPDMSGMAAAGMPRDVIGMVETMDLSGITLGYEYDKSGAFRIRYGPGTVAFSMPASLDEPQGAMLMVPARIQKMQDEMYMVHWFSPDPMRTVHCVQIVDFAQTKVFLGAMMPPGNAEDFDFAMIVENSKM